MLDVVCYFMKLLRKNIGIYYEQNDRNYEGALHFLQELEWFYIFKMRPHHH